MKLFFHNYNEQYRYPPFIMGIWNRYTSLCKNINLFYVANLKPLFHTNRIVVCPTRIYFSPCRQFLNSDKSAGDSQALWEIISFSYFSFILTMNSYLISTYIVRSILHCDIWNVVLLSEDGLFLWFLVFQHSLLVSWEKQYWKVWLLLLFYYYVSWDGTLC